jgi:hypothetical protein
MKSYRCFLFKPDGIGDFFLASGVIRFLGREFGEENLMIAVLPVMEPVVRGQFPKAGVVSLPLRNRRVILNKFVANSLRCFFPWLTLLRTKVEVSISLRNMRDYLQNVLFFSVRSPNRFLCKNPILKSNRPVRRWTELGFEFLFKPAVIEYPESQAGVPSEIEAHRLLLRAALGREISLSEIWPELKPVSPPPLDASYWVCAPFSSSLEKDYPLENWTELFMTLHNEGKLSTLVLTGSPDQRGRLMDFQTMLSKHSGVLPLQTLIVIPENLQDFIDLLAGAHCVATVDTAAAHAATALDCRTLVLFSGKHQGMFAPWIRSERQLWLLPHHVSVSAHWYDSHTKSDILEQFARILNA